MLVAQSCPTLCDRRDCSLSPWNSPGKNTGVGCHSLLQGIFLTQGSNPGLQHCRHILYHLSHQGSLVEQGTSRADLWRTDIGTDEWFLIQMIQKHIALSRSSTRAFHNSFTFSPSDGPMSIPLPHDPRSPFFPLCCPHGGEQRPHPLNT